MSGASQVQRPQGLRIMSLRFMPRFFFAAFTGLLFLLAAGCDTVAPGVDSVILTADVEYGKDGRPILFSFTGSTVTSGTLTDIRCNCQIDLGSYLSAQGFSKQDIVAATLTEARLVMGTPISGKLDVFDQAVLKLQTATMGATELASSSSLPAAREAALDPETGRSATSFVSAASFEPVLQVQSTGLDPSATYQLYLSLTFRIEVASL